MEYSAEYKEKLRTAEQVAAMVESHDLIDYGHFNGKPVAFDTALAARAEELHGVEIWTAVSVPPIPETAKIQNSFIYNDWQFSMMSRVLQSLDRCYYSPIIYHMAPHAYRSYLGDERIDTRVAEQQRKMCVIQTCPMDKHGYFNYGLQNSESSAKLEVAKYAVVEVNPNQPYCLGGAEEAIHISQVDFIIEQTEDTPLADVPPAPPNEVDQAIANILMEHIHDGCCIQLGIGGMPNAVGKLIADSDLKDLGGHTEMMVESYVDMLEKGIMNGRKKEIDKWRLAFSFAIGSTKLYEYMNNNAKLASYNVNHTNHPQVISKLSNFRAINSAVQVDLYNQVNAESNGITQISGNGGLWDFIVGAMWSPGGKSFMCLPSTFTDKEGNLHSRIVPCFKPYSITTICRQMVDYIVTEFGAIYVGFQPTWRRAEKIISIAHPQFQDELIEEAKKMKIWTRTNRLGY